MASKLDILIKKFECYDYDWMNFPITKHNPLTFHHMEKASENGKRNLKNGALLTNSAHQYLHIIEELDYKKYVVLNKIFTLINLSGVKPNIEIRNFVDSLLNQFYEEHKYDKNRRGEKILKGNFNNRFKNL